MAGDPQISDKAVRKATGKGWRQWFALLDATGAARMEHRAIARWLKDEGGCDGWWSQMVAVQYERERGLRDIHQKGTGYAVSVSRTIGAPIDQAFEAFSRPEDVRLWFAKGHRADVTVGGRYENTGGDRGTYRTVRRPDLLRFTWDNPRHSPGSIVEARFTAKGPRRTSVTVQHEKLPDRAAHAAMKQSWSWALDSLRAYLETGRGIARETWLAQGGGLGSVKPAAVPKPPARAPAAMGARSTKRKPSAKKTAARKTGRVRKATPRGR